MPKKNLKRVAKTVTHEEAESYSPDILARFLMADKDFEKMSAEYRLGDDPFVLNELRLDFLCKSLEFTKETLKQLMHVAGTSRKLQDAVTWFLLTCEDVTRADRLPWSEMDKLYSDLEWTVVLWKTIRRTYLRPEIPPKLEPDEAYSRYVSGLESCCALVPLFDGKLTGDEILDSIPALASATEQIAGVLEKTIKLKEKFDADVQETVDEALESID